MVGPGIANTSVANRGDGGAENAGETGTLPFDSPADEIYGSIRTQLELAGTPIAVCNE
jgi:hypothetical protein